MKIRNETAGKARVETFQARFSGLSSVRALFWVVTIAVLACAAYLLTVNKRQEWSTYKDLDFGFSFAYPSAYSQQNQLSFDSVSELPTSTTQSLGFYRFLIFNNNHSPRIVLTVQKKSAPPDQLATEFESGLVENASATGLQQQATSYDGAPAEKISFSFPDLQKRVIRDQTIVTQNRGFLIEISVQYLQGDSVGASIADEILGTFHVNGLPN